MANLVGEGLRGLVVKDRQVSPEDYFLFAVSFAAVIVIGFSASPTLLRTDNICISPYRFLTHNTGPAFCVIPYGELVWYSTDDTCKETTRWQQAIYLGPAIPRYLPNLASSTSSPTRESYIQCVATGKFLVRGQLILDSDYFRPQIMTLLRTHALDVPLQTVTSQQRQILQEIERDRPQSSHEPSTIPLTHSDNSASTPTSNSSPPPSPIPTSTPRPPVRRSPRTVQFDVPDSEDSDSPPVEPDPVEPDPPPLPTPSPAPSQPPAPISRRRAQAPRPCYHRPPQPGDDIIVKWDFDDGSSTWLPARICQKQSRKVKLKDIHGRVIPPDTTFVIEDLSTPHRPQYTKQLTADTHGDQWSYAPEPHAPTLPLRLHQYPMPAPLYDLAAKKAYTHLCHQESLLALPFIERFRRQLQDAAFFCALLHLPVELTAQGVNEDVDTTHHHAFASADQILQHELSLTFTNEVPIGETNISPQVYAELSQATTTSEFTDLGGTPEHLMDLLDHGFLTVLQPDDDDSEMDPVPAHIASFLSTGIYVERYDRLRGATTTAHFHSLGGNQHELEHLLRHGHLLLHTHPAEWITEVQMLTDQLDHSPTVKSNRVEQELQRQGFYLIRDDRPPSDDAVPHPDADGYPPHANAHAQDTFDPASLFEDMSDPEFTDVKSAFLHDFDPNTDLRSELDDLDMEHMHSIRLIFEPMTKLRGDGRDVRPDDIQYDPETIVELRGYSPEEKRKHLEAIVKEFTGCANQGVVRISLVPEGRKALPSKLVIKVKHDATGAYERHKARWVVLGYLARYGLDFGSTYAPTSMLTTGRLIFAVAAKFGLNVSHADIPQAFLNAPVDRPIWVTLPKGISLKHDVISEFRKKHPKGIVALRLLKSLYGLQSSPALFSKTVAKFMTSIEYTRSRSDSTLYYKSSTDAQGKTLWVLVSVFVDDLLITGIDDESISTLKDKLTATFGKHAPVTWNETVSSFLGLHVTTNASHTQWRLSAEHKIKKLLETLDLSFHQKGVRAPWQSDFPNLHSSQEVPLTARQLKIRNQFRMICGTLVYIGCTVRPDIVTIVNRACQGMQNPTRMHVLYLERCLAYLTCHPDLGLVYNHNGSPIRQEITEPLAAKYADLDCLLTSPFYAFADADFASMSDPRLRSTSGFAIYCFDCLIHWQSKRQTLTAKSTLEAELISAATAADECSWLHSLASTMPFLFGSNSEDPSHAPPCPLLIDNTAALSVSNHPKTTAKSKHLRLREFRIRDYAGENQVQSVRCLWTPTRFNVADFFTKLLGTVDFPRLARFLVNAPYNPIADAASSHLGAHHLSHLPADYHSSSRQASVLTDENVVVSLFHLDIVTPIPYVPGVSSAQGGEEESTPALQSTPALAIVSGD